MSKWIDIDTGNVGTIGYLAETFNTSNALRRASLRARPCRKNGSGEACLYSWCGETNNVSLTAAGVWKIVRVNATRERAQIVELTGAALAEFLERDGYPELIPATEPGCGARPHWNGSSNCSAATARQDAPQRPE